MLNLEQSILNHCAPTLAGVKASSMFSIRHINQSKQTLYNEILLWKIRLLTKGLSLRILNYKEQSSVFLILIYRKDALEHSLFMQNKLNCLSNYGYPTYSNLDAMLNFLSNRIKFNETFPHEIGFFLDYPFEDVVGFIKHQGKNYTCSGLWKSYSNPIDAMKRFNMIRQCTENYWNKFDEGKSVMQLIQVSY